MKFGNESKSGEPRGWHGTVTMVSQLIRTWLGRFVVVGSLVIASGVLTAKTTGAEDGPNSVITDESSSNRWTYIDDHGFEVTLEPIAPGSNMHREVSRRKLSDDELEKLRTWHPAYNKDQGIGIGTVVVLAILFGVTFAFFLFTAKYYHDKRAIVREIAKHGGTVESIEFHPACSTASGMSNI